MFPKVSIIILNYQGWQDTIDCLKSLDKLTYPNFNIIIVDNASQDESFEKIEEFLKRPVARNPRPATELIRSSKNLGFAGGNNLGIKKAFKNNADYILFLNNDTLVSPDFLSKLIKIAKKDSKIGILGPKIYFASEPQKIWFLGGKFSWLKTRWTKGRGHLGYDFPAPEDFEKKPQKVDFITGCALLIKKEVVKKIGLLVEDYFLYYEDVDWCLSARKAGFFCVVVPKAQIWHKISASVSQLGNPLVLRYHFRNALLLIDRQAFFAIKFLKHFWAGWILAKQFIKIIFLPQKRQASFGIINGIFDFYQKKFGKIEE